MISMLKLVAVLYFLDFFYKVYRELFWFGMQLKPQYLVIQSNVDQCIPCQCIPYILSCAAFSVMQKDCLACARFSSCFGNKYV